MGSFKGVEGTKDACKIFSLPSSPVLPELLACCLALLECSLASAFPASVFSTAPAFSVAPPAFSAAASVFSAFSAAAPVFSALPVLSTSLTFAASPLLSVSLIFSMLLPFALLSLKLAFSILLCLASLPLSSDVLSLLLPSSLGSLAVSVATCSDRWVQAPEMDGGGGMCLL